ncbi:unnamed protein product, partial [Didymodactylos carnosus]
DNDLESVKTLFQRTAALSFMPLDEIDALWCSIMDDYSHINYYDFPGARTNNSVEGWHHRLNSQIGVIHPNLYLFIKEIKDDYAFNVASVKQAAAQQRKVPRRKIYAIRNARILDLMERYKKGTLTKDDYLSKISKTIDSTYSFEREKGFIEEIRNLSLVYINDLYDIVMKLLCPIYGRPIPNDLRIKIHHLLNFYYEYKHISYTPEYLQKNLDEPCQPVHMDGVLALKLNFWPQECQSFLKRIKMNRPQLYEIIIV